MTLRHKIADWISGGELTRSRAQTQAVLDAMFRLNKLDNAKAAALRQIITLKEGRAIDMNTAPRMAAIAKEALE